jgi:hypothetical protein
VPFLRGVRPRAAKKRSRSTKSDRPDRQQFSRLSADFASRSTHRKRGRNFIISPALWFFSYRREENREPIRQLLYWEMMKRKCRKGWPVWMSLSLRCGVPLPSDGELQTASAARNGTSECLVHCASLGFGLGKLGKRKRERRIERKGERRWQAHPVPWCGTVWAERSTR